MNHISRTAILAIGIAAIGLGTAAGTLAQDAGASYEATLADIKATFGTVPSFFSQYPKAALPGAWERSKALWSGDTALPAKTKELIGLGVAAQIPCAYCVWAHTNSAKAAGATDAEIQEAIAVAALTRHWSTVAQGLQIDLDTFKRELSAEVASPTK